MKNFFSLFGNVAHAAQGGTNVDNILSRLADVVINPAIGIMVGVAIIVFIWGVIEYIRGAANPEKREVGTQHMIWGILGIFIMVSVFGIMRLICGFIGVSCS